jgi:hypothetical protein
MQIYEGWSSPLPCQGEKFRLGRNQAFAKFRSGACMLGRYGASLVAPCRLILALMVSVVGGWTFPQTQDLKGVEVGCAT